ncbi:MAG TPA: tyrosine-type recombinase/integrase [Gemmataceae bacterium]|nr:tyrosine-type recombinase/integrase [Gemmataceae bacterium]
MSQMNAVRIFNPFQPAAELPTHDNPTVREIIDRYLTSSQCKGTHSDEAFSERRRVLAGVNVNKDKAGNEVTTKTKVPGFADLYGDMLVADMRPSHLEDWIEATHSWRSSSTRKAKAVQVCACFNWAKAGGRCGNPFSGVNYPEAPPKPPMPDDTFDQISKHANKPFERILQFLRLTGCRLSDACGLTWEHIDWARGIIVLDKHKSKKKTGKAKVIVLVDAAVEFLRDVQANHYETGIVFRNNRNNPWDRRILGQQLRRLKKVLGLDIKPTLHGIRHQAGTQAIKNGASLKFVSLMLGHASTAITEKYYVHVDQDLDGIRAAANAAQKVEAPKRLVSATALGQQV